jgi:uncharacterized protein
MTSKILFLSFSLIFITFSMILAKNQDEGKKSILIVYGGWEGHDPEGFKDLFLPWLEEQGFNVTVSNSLEIYADKEKMENFDLIIQAWTMGEMTKDQSNGLLAAVKNGAGLAGCHGGTGDSFRSNTGYLFMAGAQFVAHPGGQIEFTVNFENHDDPITKGLSDFSIYSEQYYMLVDPGVEVLASTTFNGEHADWIEGVKMPTIWKKIYGKGKVFYSSIGHSVKDFEVYEVMEVMKRGFLWAIKDN